MAHLGCSLFVLTQDNLTLPSRALVQGFISSTPAPLPRRPHGYRARKCPVVVVVVVLVSYIRKTRGRLDVWFLVVFDLTWSSHSSIRLSLFSIFFFSFIPSLPLSRSVSFSSSSFPDSSHVRPVLFANLAADGVYALHHYYYTTAYSANRNLESIPLIQKNQDGHLDVCI